MKIYNIHENDWDSQLTLWQKAYWENTPEYKIAEFISKEEFRTAVCNTPEYQLLQTFIENNIISKKNNSVLTREEQELFEAITALHEPEKLDPKTFFITLNKISLFKEFLKKKWGSATANNFSNLCAPVISKSEEIIKAKLDVRHSTKEKDEIMKAFKNR